MPTKPRYEHKKVKRPDKARPNKGPGKVQSSSRPLKLYSDLVKSNKLLSKPWGEKEIRLYDSNVKATLNRSLWKLLKPQIMQGHSKFLKLLRDQDESAAPFLIYRLAFD